MILVWVKTDADTEVKVDSVSVESNDCRFKCVLGESLISLKESY